MRTLSIICLLGGMYLLFNGSENGRWLNAVTVVISIINLLKW